MSCSHQRKGKNMQYKVMPLLYSGNEKFKNTIRFSVEFIDVIDFDSLSYAVKQVKKRYPYFSVKIKEQNEEFVLVSNPKPFIISKKNRPICLNSRESNEHLLAFAYDNNIISVDISHFICDGNGLIPLVKTLCYYYILRRYNDSGIDVSNIYTTKDNINDEEYLYPIPNSPLLEEHSETYQFESDNRFSFDTDFFKGDSAYAYHLQIKQADLMKFAKSNHGSPLSLISIMLYKAVIEIFPQTDKDIIFQIPHTYRETLKKPLSHDCLASVVFAKLSPKQKGEDMGFLNDTFREQISLGCNKASDIRTINGLIQLDAYMDTLPLSGKKKTMQEIISSTLLPHTFGVSYTGNISWGGMEKYIADVHPYAGEMRKDTTISAEIFTIGEYFSLCIMQKGKNPVFVKQLIKCFDNVGIECILRGEIAYQLPDYLIP